MTDAEELEWHRDWRNRLMSAIRLWWSPKDYSAACKAWTQVTRILAEEPPHNPDRSER